MAVVASSYFGLIDFGFNDGGLGTSWSGFAGNRGFALFSLFFFFFF